MQNTTDTTVLIVGSNGNAPGSQALKKAANSLGVAADIALVDSPETLERIQKATQVIYRLRPKSYDTFLVLSQKLTGAHGDLLISMLNAFDKYKTYEILTSNNIATPSSRLIGPQATIETYPVVAKILNGNQGIGVALLASDADFEDFKATFPEEREFLLQEFIEESKGADARLFVVGKRVVAAMRRVAETGDFRANIHLGARMETYIPTAEEVDLAIRAVSAFGLPYAGVDIIASNKGPLVLEVNPSPGFGIQEVSDTDITAEVIKGVLND